MKRTTFIISSILVGCWSVVARGDQPNFNRDIRPILSDRCYFCHGPDAETRASGLRLDSADEAREAIESGELIRRILSDDPDEQMPPPEAKLELTDQQKKMLKAWVDSGAKYEDHWAFEPLPAEVAVPNVDDKQWSKQTLDKFVFQKFDQQGFKPTAEASPLRWLRRVTFDLTGLPPTVEQIDSFTAALKKQTDYEKVYADVVDRLLASEAYGEHMAIGWLDAARYADSYGYQSDRLNTQWPYRDWVVKAFNDNLPYDEFLTWQLAGDLLESPTREQRLATAFNRIHRLNNEGGAVFEEWRIENVADRVQTFGTAVLGLTLECSRCHDHKYDPIPMRDYYALSAFFNSIDENGVYDNSEKVPMPSLLLPTPKQEAKLKQAQKDLELAESAYAKAVKQAGQKFETWDREISDGKSLANELLALSFDVPFEDKLKEIYYSGTSDAYPAAPLSTVEVKDVPFPQMDAPLASDAIKKFEKKDDQEDETESDKKQKEDPQPSDSKADDSNSNDSNPGSPLPRLAVQLDGERGVIMPGVPTFDRWTPFTVSLTLKETKRTDAPSVIVQCSRGQLTFNGWDLLADNGFLEFRMYRVWPGNAIGVRTTEAIPVNQWHQLTATYDGSSQAEGLKLFLNGKQLETKIVRNKIKKRALVKVMHGGKLVIGQRFRGRGLADWWVDDFRVYDRAISMPEIQHLVTGKPVEPTKEFYASAIDVDARAALEKLTEARHALVMVEEAMNEIPIMDELDQPRETHVLARGAYDAATSDQTRVTRKTFTNIGPKFPADAPLDRLGLAQWATLPNHPLTSRVFVNRIWANFFGNGLVGTPENFGLQGTLPTHPELLDWLARDFINDGWDIKRLCRRIVLSATYRQDSSLAKTVVDQDPENEWLARGPAHRLSSEQIRDLALASSGLLNPKRGGPPVSPYQAGGDLWRESNSMSPAYKQSVGTDLYRRSLYSVWKRTAPLPNMLAFDAESREVCIVKRSRTNTPLQALVLLNDVQFVEASRKLAAEVLNSDQSTEKQIELAFVRLVGRKPDEREFTILTRFYQSQSKHYSDEKSAAELLIKLGESKPDASLDPVELASMTTVCQAILNSDMTIWKR